MNEDETVKDLIKVSKFKVNQPVQIKDNSAVLKWFPSSGKSLWVQKNLDNGMCRVFDGQGSFDIHEDELEECEGEFIKYFRE